MLTAAPDLSAEFLYMHHAKFSSPPYNLILEFLCWILFSGSVNAVTVNIYIWMRRTRLTACVDTGREVERQKKFRASTYPAVSVLSSGDEV
jgi:hypothetical protein